MAANRLPAPAPEKVARYSVIGKYLSDHGTSFVQHVAILRGDAELHYAMPNVMVWHMGPPLVVGGRSATAAQKEAACTAHLAGMVKLDEEDLEGIETWLAEVDKENRPPIGLSQYIVHPPMCWVEAENKSRLYRRFSCAGFVLECYRSIGIELIGGVEAGSLPEIDLETVAKAYGPEVRRELIRRKLGIPGGGPWRILLAGYVIHALDRPDAVIRNTPHVPGSVAEREFPLSPTAPPDGSENPGPMAPAKK